MNIKFNCPACLRQTHRVDASDAATEIRDRTCGKCGRRFRFKIEPQKVRGATLHFVTNVSRLNSNERNR